jgi:hypothetical protein
LLGNCAGILASSRPQAVVDAVPQLQSICMDVANGYSESFVEAVRKVGLLCCRMYLHLWVLIVRGGTQGGCSRAQACV